MRILKRNLAFMLAMIMALSLTAFAGYEDYPDVDELTYVEAVDVLTELGIVEGSNGKLLPTGNLTRAQAAKLIAYTMLGKKAADALQADVAPFVDVPTYHWAAGYVEYCADQGIVGGNGDGTFAPEANVTGSAFAKMLLCAVGYGEKGEFTGASWDSTVNAQATKLGVFDGNEENVVFADAVTREEAFLYVFNALTKIMEVTYSADADEYYSGTVFNSIKGFDFDETLGAKLYDLSTKAATDVFGRDSYNWYKGAKKIAGMYHEAPTAVYTKAVKSGTLFTDLDLDETTKATVWNNGEKESFQIKKNDKTNGIGGNGVLIEAYVDEDLNVTLIQIDTYLAKVEDVLDEDVTMTVYGHETLAEQTVETDMDLVKGDYVLVTIVDDEIQTLVLAEKINGVLDARGAVSNYTKMDGTKYSHSEHLVQTTATWEPKFDGVEMVMIMDEYGYMIGLKPVSSTEKLDGYVLVTDSEFEVGGLAASGKALVEVLYLDGTGYDVLSLDTKRTGTGSARVTKYLHPNGEWTVLEDGYELNYGFYGYYMTEDDEIVLVNLADTNAAEAQLTSAVITAGSLPETGVGYESADAYIAANVIVGDGATNSVVYANGKQQFVFGNDLKNLVLDNESVLNLVTSSGVETVEGYKNIKINETGVDALVIYKGRTVETVYVVDGSLVDKDLYAYYNGTEFEVVGSKTYIPMYLNGELQYFTWAAAVDADIDNLVKGDVAKIELEGSKIVAVTEVLTAADQIKVKSTASNGKYFIVTGDVNVTYADGVKVYDMTDGGAEIEKVVKGDTVVYLINEEAAGEVATHIWVVSHNKKTAEVGPDLVEYTMAVEVAGNTATVTVEGALEAEDGVYVMMWKDGKYSNVGYATYAGEADGVYTYTFTNNYSDDYEFAFKLIVDGETLITDTVAIAK